MSVFTTVIIIWAIFQVIVSVLKKSGKQQTPGKPSDPFKLPDGRFIKESFQGTFLGSWRDQLTRGLQDASYKEEEQAKEAIETIEAKEEGYKEDTVRGVSLIRTNSQDLEGAKDGSVRAERTAGNKGISEIEGYTKERAFPEEPTKIPQQSSDFQLSLTEREVVLGVMWAEILGKPRGLRPFRGPRS
jgi:hypothetical protein